MLLATVFLTLSVSAHAGFMAVANISKIHGKAFINKTEVKEGSEVAEGMTLSIPKAKDFVDIKFQNGHVVRCVGASVKVENLTPKATLFNLIKGKIFLAIKPLSQNETFTVKTKRASFGVRGTHFAIEESKKSTYLCVCDGVVNTKTDKGEVDVKKDEDITLAPKRELKATLAAKSMIDMGKAVYLDMGVPVQ